MTISISQYLAATASYDCGSYGAGSFGSCQTGTSTASGSSILANTGYDVLIPLSLGLAIIIASLILLVKSLRKTRLNSPK